MRHLVQQRQHPWDGAEERLDLITAPLQGGQDVARAGHGQAQVVVAVLAVSALTLWLSATAAIAALAERASRILLRRAEQYGVNVRTDVPVPAAS